MKKEAKALVLIVLIITIIGTIFLINGLKGNGLDEDTAICISEKSKLFVSKTCGHCVTQKEILGEYIELFDVVEVTEHPEVWDEYSLRGVPAWIINDETYFGVRSGEQLKSLTEC